jgi:hypothetical protein
MLFAVKFECQEMKSDFTYMILRTWLDYTIFTGNCEVLSPASGRARDFSVRQSVHSGSGDYPVSYPLAKERLICQRLGRDSVNAPPSSEYVMKTWR